MSSRYSYWNSHEYHRRSIKKDFLSFCGWDVLLELVEDLDPLPRALVAFLFETGGRASEILTLKHNQIDTQDPEILMVRRMKVLKHRKDMDRTFPIWRQDPLVAPMLEYINQRPRDSPIFPFSYSKLYKIIRDLQKPLFEQKQGVKLGERGEGVVKHGPWYPHRFRAERASQLVVEKNFSVFELMKWFGWTRSDTPTFYVGLNEKVMRNKIIGG